MVNDAEQFKEEDKKVRERIEVKNSLESYCLNMKKLIFD
jgi:heat shock protein 5